MAPSSRNPPLYEKNEICLCFHGPVLYESKVMDVEQDDPKDKKSNWKYLVHYQGWKKSWDEWLEDGRMRKNTEENRETMRQQHQSQRNVARQAAEARKDSKKSSKSEAGNKRKRTLGGDVNSSARGSEERGSSMAAAPAEKRGTKRARDWELEKEEIYLTKPAIKIPLPDLLKSMLVDDWEWITKDTKLVPLPHPHPVAKVLADYAATEAPKRRPGSAEADVLEEVVQGVKEYFDKSLGRILLYRFERQQWFELSQAMNKDPSDPSAVRKIKLPSTTNTTTTTEDATSQPQQEEKEINLAGKVPSDIYGAEHLCRLFVSMPELVAQTNMDAQSVAKLREELGRLTGWLGRNWRRYESGVYVDPGEGYRVKARGMS